MEIQIRTDKNIEGDVDLATHVEAEVRGALGRFEEQMIGVSVHLSDENSAQKFGTDDHRCNMVARLAGLDAISVSEDAATVEQAVEGAVEKLYRAIESTLGRLGRRQSESP